MTAPGETWNYEPQPVYLKWWAVCRPMAPGSQTILSRLCQKVRLACTPQAALQSPRSFLMLVWSWSLLFKNKWLQVWLQVWKKRGKTGKRCEKEGSEAKLPTPICTAYQSALLNKNQIPMLVFLIDNVSVNLVEFIHADWTKPDSRVRSLTWVVTCCPCPFTRARGT